MMSTVGRLDHSGICPACRRVLPLGAPCPVDGRAPLDARVPAERATLVDAIWGAPEARAALVVASRSGAPRRARAGLVAASAWMLMGWVTALPTSAIVVLAAAIGGFAALLAGRTRMRLLPSGAILVPTPARYAAGVITAADELLAPGSGTLCAAWVVELHQDTSKVTRVTLRVGRTAGMLLELDGGAQVRIPPGPLYLDGTPPQLGDLEHSLEDMLNGLDPARSRHDAWPLFPFNVVAEQTLHIGDRVEVFGALAPVFVAGASAPLYRDAPSTELAPVGVPVLRLLP